MDVREDDDAKAAEQGVKKLENFYALIKMPTRFSEAGVKEEDLKTIAEKAVENGNLGVLTSIGKEDVLAMMRDKF
jgi:hypothetical protein